MEDDRHTEAQEWEEIKKYKKSVYQSLAVITQFGINMLVPIFCALLQECSWIVNWELHFGLFYCSL